MKLAAIVAAAWLALPASASAAVSTAHVWRADLDDDGHRETVRLRATGTSPVDHRWLQVVDRVGGRRVTARISPRVNELHARRVVIRDLNARPRRPEIFYVGILGGTAGAPTFAGIRGWNGTGKHRFWSYSPPYGVIRHGGTKTFYDGAIVKLMQLARADRAGMEVRLHEARVRPADALCCPTWERTVDFRYSAGDREWVKYRARWRRL